MFKTDFLDRGIARIRASHLVAVATSGARTVLARMLLLSLAFHVAVVMAVRPRPYPLQVADVVISARLMEAEPDMPEPPVVPPIAADEEVVEAVHVEAPAPVQPPQAAAVPEVPQLTRTEPESTRPETPVAGTPQPAALAPEVPEPALVPPPLAQSGEVGEAKPPDTPRPAETSAALLPSVPVMVDTNWYEARELDASPKPVRRITPVYPPEAIQQGIEGTVKLMLRIDEFGEVREVEMLEDNPPGVFSDSALQAFKAGHFISGRRNGQPVRSLIYVRVHYELKD